MRTALRAELALAYLQELSPAVSAAVVVCDGTAVAGEATLAGVAEAGPETVVVREGADVLVARVGGAALPGLTRLDAALALGAVRGGC